MSSKDEVILVTGGGGFLGRHVRHALIDAGYVNLRVADHKQFDLTKEHSVQEMYNEFNPSVVIHLAARVGGIGRNQREPAEMLCDNVLMGIHLIRQASLRGVRKFIQVGTGCSYPENSPVPTTESCLWKGYPVQVTAPYGVAKLVLFPVLESCCRQSRMSGVYLIPANLYGPGDNYKDDNSHVIPALIKKFVGGARAKTQEVVVWGNPNVTRDFLYVKDCASAICKAVHTELPLAPINLSSGVETRMGDVVELLKELTSFSGDVVWDDAKPTGYPRRCLDNSLARSLLGFVPRTSLEVGLSLAIKDYIDGYTAR